MARSILSFGMFFRAGLDYGRTKPGIHRGIRQAELGGDSDFARELREELGADRVLLALLVHDILELDYALPCGPQVLPKSGFRDGRMAVSAVYKPAFGRK